MTNQVDQVQVERAKMIDKARKLFATAASLQETNEELAIQYSQAGQKILEDHAVSMAELRESGNKALDPIINKKFYPTYADMSWRRILAGAVAEFNMCKVVLINDYIPDTKKPGFFKDAAGFDFFGREGSIEVAFEMYTFLSNLTMRLGREYAKAVGRKNEMVPFERGMGTRLADRLRELFHLKMLEAQKAIETADTKNALVIIKNELAEATAAMEEGYSERGLKKKNLKADTSSAASRAGKMAANAVPLTSEQMTKKLDPAYAKITAGGAVRKVTIHGKTVGTVEKQSSGWAWRHHGNYDPRSFCEDLEDVKKFIAKSNMVDYENVVVEEL